MSRIRTAPNIYLKAGAVLSFEGTAKDQAVYWILVGHDEVHGEIAALGSLRDAVSLTDASGYAVNLYIAPTTEPETGYHDHLIVKAVIV